MTLLSAADPSAVCRTVSPPWERAQLVRVLEVLAGIRDSVVFPVPIEGMDQFPFVLESPQVNEIDIETRVTARGGNDGGYLVNDDCDLTVGVHTDALGDVVQEIALIDDQLLSVDDYLELYDRHGFGEAGAVALTPVHSITWARK
jgi:hypothetical protein